MRKRRKEEDHKRRKAQLEITQVLLRMLEPPMLQESGRNAGENIGAGQQLNYHLHVSYLKHRHAHGRWLGRPNLQIYKGDMHHIEAAVELTFKNN